MNPLVLRFSGFAIPQHLSNSLVKPLSQKKNRTVSNYQIGELKQLTEYLYSNNLVDI